MSEHIGLRGRAWFKALTENNQSSSGNPGTVLASEAQIGDEIGLFLCVVPDPASRFPCVRDGQVGLEEAFTLAHHLRRVIAEDRQKPKATEKRPVIAIVDVKSQAYGRREETAGIFFAAAASSDAHASARIAGHPVISLVAGQAFSGGFLTHGYQANRILSLRRFWHCDSRDAQGSGSENHAPFRRRNAKYVTNQGAPHNNDGLLDGLGKFNEVAIDSLRKRRRERRTNEPGSATKRKNPSSNQSGISGVAVWITVRPPRGFLGTSGKLQLSAIRWGLSSQRKIGTAR